MSPLAFTHAGDKLIGLANYRPDIHDHHLLLTRNMAHFEAIVWKWPLPRFEASAVCRRSALARDNGELRL